MSSMLSGVVRIAVMVCWAVLAYAEGATAGSASSARATVEVEFTTDQPGTATGVIFRSRLRNQDDASAPPIALRRLINGFPPGGKVDTAVPGRCTATDEELQFQGDGICPSESVVGTGWAEIDITGIGLQRFNTTAFNEQGQQVETVKQGNQVNAVVRGFFTPEGLDARIPTCITGGQPPEGCPFDQSRLVANELVTPPITRGGRSYFTTPPTCPSSRRWRSPVILTYADGVTERLYPEQPCQPAAAPSKTCRSQRRVLLRRFVHMRLKSITAIVKGRRVRLNRRRPVIDLRGLPRGRYTVRITAVRNNGQRVRIVRRYRICGSGST